MLNFYQKYWRTAFDIALIALTVFLIMFVFSYLYKIAAPVFLSFLIYLFIEPPARWLAKLGLSKSIAAGISVLLFTIVILGLFFGAGYMVVSQINGLVANLPEYQRFLSEQIASNSAYLQEKLGTLPPEALNQINDFLDQATKWGQNVATDFLHRLGGYLSSVSTFVFNFALGIVLAYFLSIEINSWKKLASEKTPRTFKNAFFFLRDNVFRGIGAYLKAQFKLISITFIVVFAALMLLGVKNALSISLLAAVFDILPLLGVGTIFVPWIIYLFIVGDVSLAIWLTALFLVVVLTRQILEPKITGDTLGVSAFTMLVIMVVSLSLFGVAGVILSPILTILLKALYDQGYLRRWIRLPQGEYDTVQQEPPPNAN